MNKPVTPLGAAVVAKPKLSAVLNGGSDTLESARIPIQFGVNAALAEIQPTHVLVIIQHEKEVGASTLGTRYLIPLSRGSDFICFESAGKHTVTLIALKSERGADYTKKVFEPYLREVKPGRYANFIDLRTDGHDGRRPCFEDSSDADLVVAISSKTLLLPEELFAKKPSGWVSNWANLWHRYQPNDQCSYRKRLIFAFTLKFPIWFVVAVVAKYLWATVASLWLIVAKMTALILGWRPEPIFKDFGSIWSWHWSPNSIDWDITRKWGYGVWKGGSGNNDKYYPITGAALLLIGVFGVVMFGFVSEILSAVKDPDLWAFVMLLGIFTVLVGVILWLSWTKIHFIERCMSFMSLKWESDVERRRQKRQMNGKPLYFEWLLRALGDDKLPAKVDWTKTPAAFRQPVAHRFRLSVHAAKAAVCKPFSRH